MLTSKHGSAIVIVLIILFISLGLTFFGIRISRRVNQSSYMLMNKLQAEIGADSAIEKLKFYILTGKPYSSYVEKQTLIKMPAKIYLDGRIQKLDNYTSVSLKDIGSKLNIWSFNFNILQRLLANDNLTESKVSEIINSLKDWYDSDDLNRLHGAEALYYSSKECKYSPRNFSGVQSIYEWRLIKGIEDNKTFNFLKKYLTISPGWHPDINSMDKYMLSAFLDIPLYSAENLVKIRNEKGFLDNKDLNAFLKPNSVMNSYFYPTFIIDIKVEFRFNGAVEKRRCEIDFAGDKKAPYRVIEWIN